MSAAKHTPGPWTWRPDYRGLASKSGDDVLTFYEYENMWLTFGITREANARLIAAAPELLAALRDLLAVAPYQAPGLGIVGMKERHAAAINTARAAIAKAEGKE